MNPRRVLLLLGGLAAFAAVYIVYAQVFGWLDGLPILPPKMLEESTGEFRPPPSISSPTIELIKVAFGETGPEMDPLNYPTQLRFKKGETTLILAAGTPPSNPNSNRVTMVPFSMAIFGKPRPDHLRKPGEVDEFSTVHSDRAVLEFDRVIHSTTEMGTAKLVRLELISDPEQAIKDPLGRVGKVHIVNNQRSADLNRRLVMRTVGPVFYRDAKVPPGSPPLTGPDIWTDAPVEIVDRSNLPRREGAPAVAAPATAEEVRNYQTVADILGGQRLPPPTITAVGMRVYLEPPVQPGKPAPKREASVGFAGVQRIEFLEKVLMNLWVEGGKGLVGSSGKPSVIAEPSVALSAVGGGLMPGAHAARTFGRDLLQIETRGPFAYDSEKNLARFDVLPLADPNLTNDVQVTKVPPRPGTQTLFSQVLELEFNGSPTGATPQAPTPGNTPPPSNAKFKRIHAWTYTPGRFLTVSSDLDNLEAYGQDLVHEAAGEKTRLTGSPLYAVQSRNVLTAGGQNQPGILILEPPPNRVPGRPSKNQATVLGPGRVELWDAAANATSGAASWQTSMVQTQERVSDRDIDLYTFTDAAKFEDVRSDFWLKGKVLKLWLLPMQDAPGEGNASTSSRTQLHRLQALGDVTGHSEELDIDQAEYLNTFFREELPTAQASGPVAPTSPEGTSPKPVVTNSPPKGPPTLPVNPAPAPVVAKPANAKPPMKIRARSIDTWATRSPESKVPAPAALPMAVGPLATPAATASKDQASSGKKYRLEKARCEGNVSVHQDPADAKKPRGTDIAGSLMLIDSTPDGSVLQVFGWDDRPGEFHNEGNSLIGPKILLDQLHNVATVEGRGSLVMPASSDLSGTALKQAEVVVVHFRDGMAFHGSKKVADFFGKVTASQGDSWVTCHTLQVNFDRPVYLSQANKPVPKDGKPADPNADKPKIDVVYCYPAPADSADAPQEKQVWYNQLERDTVSGRPIRRQQIVARELTLRAQTRDASGGEPYKLILAEGPGTVRIWQPSSKSDTDAGAAGPAGPVPAPNPMTPPTPVEMKLTIVHFSGRMIGKDKGAIYKEATFFDSIRVIEVPTENPDLIVEWHKLPPRATLLTCSDKLVVWSHTKPKEPTEQHMEAYGNASLRTDEYDGWGETIRNNGKVVIFDGEGSVPARIKSRVNGNDQSGRRIIYDRATNHFKVEGSIGGTITPSPSSGKSGFMPVPRP